jgi:ATP-dependent DNA ligase
LLNHDTGIPITYCIFDVLEHNGELTLRLPYRERRQLLDSLHMNGPNWQTAPSFPDADAFVDVVNNRGLKGIVAKRLDGIYRPDYRGWTKIKNRSYWRFELQREAVRRSFTARSRSNWTLGAETTRGVLTARPAAFRIKGVPDLA